MTGLLCPNLDDQVFYLRGFRLQSLPMTSGSQCTHRSTCTPPAARSGAAWAPQGLEGSSAPRCLGSSSGPSSAVEVAREVHVAAGGVHSLDACIVGAKGDYQLLKADQAVVVDVNLAGIVSKAVMIRCAI